MMNIVATRYARQGSPGSVDHAWIARPNEGAWMLYCTFGPMFVYDASSEAWVCCVGKSTDELDQYSLSSCQALKLLATVTTLRRAEQDREREQNVDVG